MIGDYDVHPRVSAQHPNDDLFVLRSLAGVEHLRAGRVAEARAAVPEDWVRGVFAIGAADDITAAVERFRDAGVDTPILAPTVFDGDLRVAMEQWAPRSVDGATRRFLASQAERRAARDSAAASGDGSNAWALGPSRTATGHAMLVRNRDVLDVVATEYYRQPGVD